MNLRSCAAAAALALATIATCGSALAAPPSKTQAPAPLLVVDSDGKTVGRMFGDSSVLVDVNGVPTAVLLSGSFPDQNAGPTDWNTTDFRAVPLFFESEDCTGTPYARYTDVSPVAGLRRAAMVTDTSGRRYLYPNVSGVRADRSLNSMYLGACHPGGYSGVALFTLGAPVEVTTQFKAPFHIK